MHSHGSLVLLVFALCSYILTLEEYERFTSRDPVTDALSSLLCQVTADTVLGVLSESSVDAILPVIATCITTDIEAVFTQKQVRTLSCGRFCSAVPAWLIIQLVYECWRFDQLLTSVIFCDSVVVFKC